MSGSDRSGSRSAFPHLPHSQVLNPPEEDVAKAQPINMVPSLERRNHVDPPRRSSRVPTKKSIPNSCVQKKKSDKQASRSAPSDRRGRFPNLSPPLYRTERMDSPNIPNNSPQKGLQKLASPKPPPVTTPRAATKRPRPSSKQPKPATRPSNTSPTEQPDADGLYENIDVKLPEPKLKQNDIFPFLELPTELRAEIYRYLLGDNVIHIDYPGCQDARGFISGRPFLCCASISDAESFAQHGLEPKSTPIRLVFVARHSKCKNKSLDLPFHVMRLCKKVYKEACLVPFQENCFTLAAPQSLDAFLKRLTKWQREAMAHVMLCQTQQMTMWEAQRISEPMKFPIDINIKRLTIFIELCPANLKPKTSGQKTVKDADFQDRLIARMGKLWSKKLEKVEVLINNTAAPQLGAGEHFSSLSKAEVEAWTRRIKRVLLPVKDTAEMEEMDDELDALDQGTKGLDQAMKDRLDEDLDSMSSDG